MAIKNIHSCERHKNPEIIVSEEHDQKKRILEALKIVKSINNAKFISDTIGPSMIPAYCSQISLYIVPSCSVLYHLLYF